MFLTSIALLHVSLQCSIIHFCHILQLLLLHFSLKTIKLFYCRNCVASCHLLLTSRQMFIVQRQDNNQIKLNVYSVKLAQLQCWKMSTARKLLTISISKEWHCSSLWSKNSALICYTCQQKEWRNSQATLDIYWDEFKIFSWINKILFLFGKQQLNEFCSVKEEKKLLRLSDWYLLDKRLFPTNFKSKE